jgi:hypothetical protein
MRLFTRLDHAEHFLLADALDLGQRHAEPRRLFIPLLLDSATERFGVLLVATVEQILGQGFGGGLGGLLGLHIALFMGLDRLLHLDLLLAPLLRVELGPQTAVVLGALGGGMAFTGGALALALIVVEAGDNQTGSYGDG